MMPAPVQDMLIEVGVQLAPFAVGCALFVLAMLGAMIFGMLAELRGLRPPALRIPVRPGCAVELDQGAWRGQGTPPSTFRIVPVV